MTPRKLVEIRSGIAANEAFAMAEPVDMTIFSGEQIAVIGDNAAGKTRFVEMISATNRLQGNTISYDFYPSTRHYVSDNVKYVAFKDSYGTADAGYYHQLRWNHMEVDPETPTVREVLGRYRTPESAAEMDRYVEMFRLDALLDRYTITLSSGELRKMMLTRVLSTAPRILIVDNPYIGLDAAARSQLTAAFELLAKSRDITLVLVLARVEELPDFITHVIPVEGLKVLPKLTASEFLASRPRTERPLRTPLAATASSSDEVVRLRDVNVVYEGRHIIKDLSWCVRRGEHWALTGENGSGKSTLLSMICADNPMGYACDMDLFGRRRGTGETIWDIKRNIGYMSPEMHRSYKKDIPALDIVSSGIFDTVGLFHKPSPEQREICRVWMERFGIAHLASRSFLKLSSGEQRLCILARAFVKSPSLLILDEPMHGLDENNRNRVRAIIEEYCADPSRTLIMVTHYLDELPSCIDHSLVLRRNA